VPPLHLPLLGRAEASRTRGGTPVPQLDPEQPHTPHLLTAKDSDMSITAHPPAKARPARDPLRRTSLTAGVLYLVTFVSMPTLALYQGVHDQEGFVLGAGSDTGVLWAALSEVVVAVAGVGTAVVLFPVAKRQSETAALGFVASRVLEAGGILLGVVSVLTLVALRHDVASTAGADRASLVTTEHTLAAVYDNAFLLSQSLAPVSTRCAWAT
jgi:hypothetical protein